MTLDPKTLAVIGVHLQNDIAGNDGAFAPLFAQQTQERHTLDVAHRLLTGAQQAGATVVLTRVAWAPDYSDLHANSSLLQFVVQTSALKEGSTGAQLVPPFDAMGADVVHTHQRIGGLTADLDAALRDRGVTTVAVCGVATNASVEGTARQLSDAGYRVLIVEDACSAASEQIHAASIESMSLIGETTTTDELLASLAAR